MKLLGVLIMIVGGGIFVAGEKGSCLLMIIGGAINFAGLAMLIGG